MFALLRRGASAAVAPYSRAVVARCGPAALSANHFHRRIHPSLLRTAAVALRRSAPVPTQPLVGSFAIPPNRSDAGRGATIIISAVAAAADVTISQGRENGCAALACYPEKVRIHSLGHIAPGLFKTLCVITKRLVLRILHICSLFTYRC